MRDLMKFSTDSIYFKDLLGRFIMVSAAKAANSNTTPEEMIGKTDYDFMPAEEADRIAHEEETMISAGEPIVGKRRQITRPDGRKEWVSESKYLRYDDEGQLVGNIGISRIVTTDVEREQHIINMFTVASHDLRGPVASLATGLKLLKKGIYGPLSEEVQEVMNDLFDRARLLESTLNDYFIKGSVMNLSAPPREKLDLRQDIIDPVLEELSQELARQGIRIDCRLGAIPIRRIIIEAHRAWLKIVYRQVLTNAIKYAGQGAIISFGFKEHENHYHLNVWNSGPPVPEDRLEAIFEPLESSGNSGLGLAIARQLIERHGGKMWCESQEHPNFIFTISK